MSQKAFRDPLYQHIYLDKDRDKVVLDLLACPEVQRLRRIHQLGVSLLTYPGAEHSRFGHALGACHLMALALRTLQNNQDDVDLPEQLRVAALAAALLHDIGHGPYSHLLETELFPGKRHEQWTNEIIRAESSAVHQALKADDPSLPKMVAELISDARLEEAPWLSCLMHSQLDVDRMDYLLRDSYFCGVGYGRHDVDRILHTMRIRLVPSLDAKQPVWQEKGLTAVEEYIFGRDYMYWNVYYHQTTRGYEELLKAVFRRARQLLEEDPDALGDCIGALRRPLAGDHVGIDGFLALDDAVVSAQLVAWRDDKTCDKTLQDLSRRFLDRDGLKPIVLRGVTFQHMDQLAEAREAVRNAGHDPDYYFLRNEPSTSAYDYYHPEEEGDLQSAKTSILIETGGPRGHAALKEISRVSRRLRGVTGSRESKHFCYVPDDCRTQVEAIFAPSS